MTNKCINTFYLTYDQLNNTPSLKDGIDEATETTLRIYGCDLIQESGILLKLPQQVMATGQVLFHRFYFKQSFVRFNVKKVAASCIWLASQHEENARKARDVANVFHRLECRRENLPISHLDSIEFSKLKRDLIAYKLSILKVTGFVCHVEHPHKFILNYLAALEISNPKLKQEAWDFANDSLRTTLCVRFKSEVVACGVVYAAARRFQGPLPENPPWWEVFDADKKGIDEVCKALAYLYARPKAHYIPVCKEGIDDNLSPATAVNPLSADVTMKDVTTSKLKDSKRRDDIQVEIERDVKDQHVSNCKEDTTAPIREARPKGSERERRSGKGKRFGFVPLRADNSALTVQDQLCSV